MSEQQRSLQTASLKWHEDGELSSQDVFNLVCRLRAVEDPSAVNELWRLGQKYPSRQSSSQQSPSKRAAKPDQE